MKVLDVRDLACPGPVMEVRKAIEAGDSSFLVLVADKLARSNVTRYVEARGGKVTWKQRDGYLEGTVVLEEKPLEENQEAAEALACPLQRRVVVQVTSTSMGHGDSKLGRLLLRSFLKTIKELSPPPDAVVFYNEAVKLCCEGSELLKDIQALAESGVEVVSCGTCLNYFGMADKLRAGRIGDMLDIATLLAKADMIIRP